MVLFHVPYNLRKGPILGLPKIHSFYYGTNTVHFRGSLIWNNLATVIKSSDSLFEFKNKIKNIGDLDCRCLIWWFSFSFSFLFFFFFGGGRGGEEGEVGGGGRRGEAGEGVGGKVKNNEREKFKYLFTWLHLSAYCFSSISEHKKYDSLFLCNNLLHKQYTYFKIVAETTMQYPPGTRLQWLPIYFAI